VPGGGDAASVDNPGLTSATGALNCWGAGLTANSVPLTVDASLSIGAGGLALFGDPYGPSALMLETGASTSGPFVTGEAVNIDAPVTVGLWWNAGGDVNVNSSVSANGVDVGAQVNVFGSVSAGAFSGTLANSDFYSSTTALQVDGGETLNVLGGSFNCNSDAVIGTDGDIVDTSGNPALAVVGISNGGILTTSGVTYMGVANPNEPNVTSNVAGAGLVIITGSGSTWNANGDIRAGEDTNGLGSISLSQGGTLSLGSGVNLRLGSGEEGSGFVTFDGTGGSPNLDADASSSIIVGDLGLGVVTIEHGATITNGGSTVVGNLENSFGIVTVQDKDSFLTCTGDFTIGSSGLGTGNIITSGSLAASGNLFLGSEATGNGTLNIGQAASPSNSASSGTLTVNKTLTVGQAGTGDLEVTGGVVTISGPGANLVIGDASTGVGTVDINGINAIVKAGGVIVGNNGQGTLTIENGGAMAVNGDLTIASQAGSTGTVTVDGDNSVLQVSGNLTLGSDDGSTGTLTISNGAALDMASVVIAGPMQPVTAQAADTAAPSITVKVNETVDVTNGTIRNENNAELNVFGKLTVENNSLVSVGEFSVGSISAGKGIVTINGSGTASSSPSTLTFNAAADIGESDSGFTGTALVNVINGGVLAGGDEAFTMSINGSSVVTCSGTGSSMKMPRVTISTTGTGYLNVTSGAGAQAAGLLLSSLKSQLSDNTITGSGTNVQIGTTGLQIGESAPADLVISSSATVQSAGNVSIGEGAAGTLTVDNATLNAGSQTLFVGAPSTGTLTALPGANVSGDVLNVRNGSVKAMPGQGVQTILSFPSQVMVGANSSITLNTAATLTTTFLTVAQNGTFDLTGGGTANVGNVRFPQGAGYITIGAGGTVKNLGSIKGSVLVQFLGKLGGSGVITGTKTINFGAIILKDPQTLTIDGDYEQMSTGELDVELDGSDPGEYDQLDVTGNILLDAGAQLDLNFANGFAPKTGELFAIIDDPNLTADDVFSQINVSGLEPGWEYSMTQQNGNEVIESLNDGVAIPEPAMGALFMGCVGLVIGRRRRGGGRGISN
jgi:T5SS/PEP-CTERM-associated repeat protein